MSPNIAEHDDARIAALEASVERLTALLYLLNGRMCEVEGRLGATALLPVTDAETTIKAAAYATGFSPSQIRKLIATPQIRNAPALFFPGRPSSRADSQRAPDALSGVRAALVSLSVSVCSYCGNGALRAKLGVSAGVAESASAGYALIGA